MVSLIFIISDLMILDLVSAFVFTLLVNENASFYLNITFKIALSETLPINYNFECES